jgi:PAS domain S-box-containing protein
MTKGSNEPSARAERKRRKPGGQRHDLPVERPSVTYWLRGPQFIIERVEASGGATARRRSLGASILSICPKAQDALGPILERVWSSGKPMLTLLPPHTSRASPLPCTCLPQQDATGTITGIICVFDATDHPPATSRPGEYQTKVIADSAGAPLAQILHQAAYKVKQATGADAVEIDLVSETAPYSLICEAAAGATAGLVEHLIVPNGSLSKLVQTRNAPLRLYQDEIYAIVGSYRASPIARLDVQAWLGVPLDIAGETIGVVTANRLGDCPPFSATDEETLSRLAASLSLVIESARLRDNRTALQQREREMGQLLDALPAHILETDAEHRVTYMNARFAEVAGYHLGETLPFASTEPHPFWQRLDTHEPYRWCDLPIARAWQTSGDVDEIMISRVLQTGHEISFLAKAHPVRDTAGEITSVIVVMVDITAQRQAERAALEHAALRDAVIEGMQDGIVIYDAAGIPVRYNPAYLRMLGWKAAGKDPHATTAMERAAIYDVRTGDGMPLTIDQWPMNQALHGTPAASVTLSIQRLDGVRVVVEINAVPLREPLTGVIFGAVGILRDITERERLEHMREEFINIASHELRTPLTSLVLANHILQLRLRRLTDIDDLLHPVNDMAVQMKRMNRLVDNMLDLTSLTGGHFHITARQADLAQVVRDTIAEQQYISKRTITLTGATDPIPATFDAPRISQVLTNLLMNALDHSPLDRPVDVEVTLLRDRVRVAVRDYGAGIAPDQLAQIFQRFGALPMGLQEKVGASCVTGMGFGLYLAHAIVTAHGGSITADSKPGRGSVFQFEIPLHPKEPSDDASSP